VVEDVGLQEIVTGRAVHVVLPRARDQVHLRVVHDVDLPARVLEAEVFRRDDGNGVEL
jgi:hypothetical protein